MICTKFVGAPVGSLFAIIRRMKDPFNIEFSRRAKAAMKATGYTSAAALADTLNEQESRVRNWTNGASVPPLRDAVRLADAFGVTVDWLVKGDTSGLAEGIRIRLVATLAGDQPPIPTARDPAGDILLTEGPKLAKASRRRALYQANEGS